MKNVSVKVRDKLVRMDENEKKRIKEEERIRADYRANRRAQGCFSIVLTIIIMMIIAFFVSNLTR